MNNTFPENAAAAASSYADDAKEELAQLRSKVETLMNERVTPALGAAASQAQAVAKTASDEMRMQTERLSEAVQERPLASIAIATMAGFVLSSLMRR